MRKHKSKGFACKSVRQTCGTKSVTKKCDYTKTILGTCNNGEPSITCTEC